MVPLTSPPDDALEPYLGGQINAMRRRIDESNQQGDLDGLCAQHILGYKGYVAWDLDLTAGSWLEENADRFADAGPLAVLGYALANPGFAAGKLKPEASAALARFMQRDHLRGGGKLAFFRDTRILLGIGLAVLALKDEMPHATAWLANILGDTKIEPADRFHELLQQHVLTTISGAPPGLVNPDSFTATGELALMHWMIGEGTARVPDAASYRHLSGQVLRVALLCDPAELPVAQAALILRAADDIIKASIDKALLSRHHLTTMLRRFPAAMRRWRWDNAEKVKQPICWPITSEREVQDVLLVLLLPVFDDIIDEETSPKFGHASTRADFGIPSLRTLIEVKYIYHGNNAEFRDVEQQVMIDSIAYLKRSTLYDEIVVFIYDASASVEHHELTRRTLMDVDGIADVIIVSRPGVLANPSGASAGKATQAKAPARKKATHVKRPALKSGTDPANSTST